MNNQLQEIQSIESQSGFKIQAEIDKQIMTAKAFPRNVNACLANIIGFIEGDQEIADSCIYAVPAGKNKKTVEGPSVRLSELFLAEWGNLIISTKILSSDGNKVISSGQCWDIEKNISADMQTIRTVHTTVDVTASAAASIALRNAIFKIIPKAFIDKAYKIAKDVSVNGVKKNKQNIPFEERRRNVFESVKRVGISVENVLAYFNKTSIDQIDKEEIQHIIAVGTSVKENLITPQEAFQPHQPKAARLSSLIDDSDTGEE